MSFSFRLKQTVQVKFIGGQTKYTVRRVWFFQRGQKNVRNHTQVKLAATSLECKQAGTFQYTSVCVGGRFRLITRIKVLNRNLRDAKDGYSMLFVGFKLIT